MKSTKPYKDVIDRFWVGSHQFREVETEQGRSFEYSRSGYGWTKIHESCYRSAELRSNHILERQEVIS